MHNQASTIFLDKSCNHTFDIKRKCPSLFLGKQQKNSDIFKV